MDDFVFPQSQYGDPFVLHKRKVHAQGIVLQHFMDVSFDEEVVKERMRDEIRFRLVTTVLEEQLVEKTHSAEVTAHVTATATAVVELEHPTSWYQHLKRDKFPEWWKRRWPVKTETLREWHAETESNSNTETVSITFRQYAQFPAAQIKTPSKYRGPIIVAREELTSDTWPKDLS